MNWHTNEIDKAEKRLLQLEAENERLKTEMRRPDRMRVNDYKRLEQEYKLQLKELVKMKENIDKIYRR